MNKKELEVILRKKDWDFGNQLLYRLCEKYPLHRSKEIVIAKILFIGRIYAAAIERRKNKRESSDDYYMDKVAPTIIKSRLDQKLFELRNHSVISKENISIILETHQYLSKLFFKISGLNKRSLSSKYLHFHNPNLFFIYDSRVVNALKKLLPKFRFDDQTRNIITIRVDKNYAEYFLKSLILKKSYEKVLGRKISLREYDKILVHFSSY